MSGQHSPFTNMKKPYKNNGKVAHYAIFIVGLQPVYLSLHFEKFGQIFSVSFFYISISVIFSDI